MPYFKRAVPGTISVRGSIHAITFEKETPIYVPDDALLIEAIRAAGCEEVSSVPSAMRKTPVNSGD